MTGTPKSIVGRWALAAVRAYQRRLSPLMPPTCRFLPTCSEYMAQAIIRYGALRGVWLGMKRIARCHPWSPGGYDPVPGAEAESSAPSGPSDSTNTGYECD
ncbi:MAG: membrane protein insertion efficiency factor YidD [Armatimonadota bacterium]